MVCECSVPRAAAHPHPRSAAEESLTPVWARRRRSSRRPTTLNGRIKCESTTSPSAPSRSTAGPTPTTWLSIEARSQARKGASKRHRASHGHTPLSAEEKIPGAAVGWSSAPAPLELCQSWTSVQAEARRRGVELVTLPTTRAIDLLATDAKTPTPFFTSPADLNSAPDCFNPRFKFRQPRKARWWPATPCARPRLQMPQMSRQAVRSSLVKIRPVDRTTADGHVGNVSPTLMSISPWC